MSTAKHNVNSIAMSTVKRCQHHDNFYDTNTKTDTHTHTHTHTMKPKWQTPAGDSGLNKAQSPIWEEYFIAYIYYPTSLSYFPKMFCGK